MGNDQTACEISVEEISGDILLPRASDPIEKNARPPGPTKAGLDWVCFDWESRVGLLINEIDQS